MDFAINLNARQSARTLDQAVRHQATVLLEPGTWLDNEGLKGRLVAVTSEVVRVEITETPMVGLDMLVGVYCDTSLLLGQDRFLFDAHVVNVERCGGQWCVELARPAKIQVCQRRRFWRVKLAESSNVRLQWGEDDSRHGVVGWLCNISGEGLACLVDAHGVDSLFIGETLATSFELPDCERCFELAAVLCNKTPTGEPDKLILGMQFLDPASSSSRGLARELNECLLQRYGPGVASTAKNVRVTDGAMK